MIHSPPPSETAVQANSRPDVDPASLASEQLVVESVELAYYVPQSPSAELIVQPVWAFRGSNADGTARFTAYVQAAVDELVEPQSPTGTATSTPQR